MPLMDFWKSNPTTLEKLSIAQVVSNAGDGSIKDNSFCSSELREYLSNIQSEKIASYVEQCLSTKLDKGGLILQDLIKELGRCLDYKVENGKYQGTTNAIGFDGIWKSPEGHAIIIEVKTSDTYRISLDTLAVYREKLIFNNTVGKQSSILIIVGRQDTGEIEAQIRGSRHAWDIRLISAEALIKLINLKENSDEVETGLKIRSVLTPLEYTRLDRLVETMFITATDVAPGENAIDTEYEEEDSIPTTVKENDNKQIPNSIKSSSSWVFTEPALLARKRDEIIAAMSSFIGSPLIKKTRALYWTQNHEKRVACTISKFHTRRPSHPYWYAYHPKWDNFYDEGAAGYLALGGMDIDIAFAIPQSEIHKILPYLNTTSAGEDKYWHIHITRDQFQNYQIVVPKGEENFDISKFKIQLQN